MTNRAISKGSILDNEVHMDNIELDIGTILQQQATDIKTGLNNLTR